MNTFFHTKCSQAIKNAQIVWHDFNKFDESKITIQNQKSMYIFVPDGFVSENTIQPSKQYIFKSTHSKISSI